MAKAIMDHDRVLRQVLREAVDRFTTSYFPTRSASTSSTGSSVCGVSLGWCSKTA
jgi:hypothetical protein